MTHLMIDLCAGTGGWQAPFEDDDDWRTVGVDVAQKGGASIIGDIMSLPLDCSPTLLCASPPCPQYSQAPVTPFDERDIDKSLWRACWGAAHRLDPDYYIIENVAGAQYWWGEADKSCHPYHFWGYFPPFDVGDVPSKQQGKGWVADPVEAARIPYNVAKALKQAVELYL